MSALVPIHRKVRENFGDFQLLWLLSLFGRTCLIVV